MGVLLVLCIHVNITIDTAINFDADVDATCEWTFTLTFTDRGKMVRTGITDGAGVADGTEAVEALATLGATQPSVPARVPCRTDRHRLLAVPPYNTRADTFILLMSCDM